MNMKIGTGLIVGGAVALMQLSTYAADKAEFKDAKEKASYGVGMYFGNQIKGSTMDVDLDVVLAAMKDVLAGKELPMNDQQAREAIGVYQKEAIAKAAEKNKKEGEAFLADNKKKAGVKTESVKLPDGTTAEMQYKVITEGTGAVPKNNDLVTINYRGTLVNGKEVEGTEKSGPVKRPLNGLQVKGWSEALAKMKAGSKWELYLPASLAYGDRGRPGMEPGSTLIYELELVSSETPQPPAPPQPLTSDIIRVPSAEELKAGAKVEVIKAEDLEKQIKAAAATNAAGSNAPKTP
jgi:FKBP-type peptidyl-prolyl cis-trans isomerase FklB